MFNVEIAEQGKYFSSKRTLSGIITVIAAIIVITSANSSWTSSYHPVWHEIHMGFSFRNWFELGASLNHWITYA